MQWKLHVRFGGRAGETHQLKGWQGAPVRPLHLCLDLVGLLLCGLHHRRLLAHDRRLAVLEDASGRALPGRPRAGDLATRPRAHRTRPSFGPRIAISLNSLHRAARRRGRCHLGRVAGRLLRQRHGRVGQLPLQARVRLEGRTMAGPLRSRACNSLLGRLVERRTAPRRAWLHAAGRVRTDPLPSPTNGRFGGRKPIAGVSRKLSATHSATPRRPPFGSSAAATFTSRRVSTPPVTGRAASTVVIAIPSFSIGQGVARAAQCVRRRCDRPVATGLSAALMVRLVPRTDLERRSTDRSEDRLTVSRFASQTSNPKQN